MHRKVRSYLQIEQDIIINVECVYSNNSSFNLSEDVSMNETSVHFPSDIVDNPIAFREPQIPPSVNTSKGLDTKSDSKQTNWSKLEKFDTLLRTEFPRSYQ